MELDGRNRYGAEERLKLSLKKLLVRGLDLETLRLGFDKGNVFIKSLYILAWKLGLAKENLH